MSILRMNWRTEEDDQQERVKYDVFSQNNF